MSHNPFSKQEWTHSDPVAWRRAIRAQDPKLLEIGRAAPKLVLSFGGAGFLVTYALGVAHFLAKEKKEMLSQSFVLGAGTGIIPAVALCCGPQLVNMEHLRDFVVENLFPVADEPRRLDVMRKGCEKFLPSHVHTLLNGRCALSVGMSNRDSGYYKQPSVQQLFGHHICIFDSKADVAECIVAATCPNSKIRCDFRGEKVVRGTQGGLSSELDQYIRHVHIHGLCGYPKSRQHTRHLTYFGRHGALVNTHQYWGVQFAMAIRPNLVSRFKDMHLEAFDNGFHDARRYERWEEDPYFFAKPDRSPSEDADWRSVRAGLASFAKSRGKGGAGASEAAGSRS